MRKCCKCGAEIEVRGDPPTEQLLCMDCFDEIRREIKERLQRNEWFLDGDEGVPVSVKPNEN